MEVHATTDKKMERKGRLAIKLRPCGLGDTLSLFNTSSASSAYAHRPCLGLRCEPHCWLVIWPGRGCCLIETL
jgi:hypothetical protein